MQTTRDNQECQMDVQMSDVVREDKQYRQTPQNGHCLLLMEAQEGEKTYSDYSNILNCVLSIQNMFEKYRAILGLDHEQYVIADVHKWIDDFRRIELFIFDHELARYKRNTRRELKDLIVDQIQRSLNQASQSSGANSTTNNHNNNHNNHNNSRQAAAMIRGSTGSTPEDDEDAEDWDDM